MRARRSALALMALGSAALAQAQDAQQTVVFTAERAPPEDSQGLRQAPVDADLDPLAPNRWQRVSGQVGVYVVPVGDFISSLQLRLIFPAEGVERASVEEAGQTITSDRVALPRFAGDSAACASPTVTSEDPILVCPIPGSPWLDVMWLVQFGECTESATLTLRGEAADPAQIVSIRATTPKPDCSDDDDDTPVALIAGVAAAVVVALIIAALVCCKCIRARQARTEQKPAGGAAWHRDDNDPRSEAETPAVARPSTGHRVSAGGAEPVVVGAAAVGADLRERPAQRTSSHANGGSAAGGAGRGAYNGGVAYGPGVAVAREEPNGNRRYEARQSQPSAASTPDLQVASGTAKTGSSTATRSRKEQPRTKSRESLQAAAMAAAAANAPRDASDEEDDGPDRMGGPTMMDEEEPVDVQQQAMLQEVHLQQIAGITDMIQGVKDNLMQQQTLKHNIKQESSLEIFEKIGGGGFGEVFKGSFKGKEVAVKIMKIKPGAKQESLTELPYTEAAIAGICIHANIVQTLYSDLLPVLDREDGSTFWSKAKDERAARKEMAARAAAAKAGDAGVKEWQVRMVMEICDLGSVRDWVSHVAGQKYGALYSSLPTKAGTKGCGRTLCALLTSLDVANGMKLLHKYKILHSDLKPHNVLLVSSHTDPRGFMAKLSDFGLSMKMAAHDGQVPGIKYGTVQYLAPEVLSTHIMTKRADVYSFGIIMWEVWHSRLFAEFYNIEKKKRKPLGQAMDDYRPSVSSKCPHEYVRLMEQCLHKDPEERPDFLGGKINIVVELERLIFEEYQRLAQAALNAHS